MMFYFHSFTHCSEDCPATQPIVCRLMVCTPAIHINTWITTYLPTPEGWKAELAQLIDPDTLLANVIISVGKLQ